MLLQSQQSDQLGEVPTRSTTEFDVAEYVRPGDDIRAGAVVVKNAD